MAAAATRGGVSFCFKNEQGKIQRELEAAQKDNDFIYHDKVPDVKTLPALGKLAVAKPLPIPEKFSTNFVGEKICFVMVVRYTQKICIYLQAHSFCICTDRIIIRKIHLK